MKRKEFESVKKQSNEKMRTARKKNEKWIRFVVNAFANNRVKHIQAK